MALRPVCPRLLNQRRPQCQCLTGFFGIRRSAGYARARKRSVCGISRTSPWAITSRTVVASHVDKRLSRSTSNEASPSVLRPIVHLLGTGGPQLKCGGSKRTYKGEGIVADGVSLSQTPDALRTALPIPQVSTPAKPSITSPPTPPFSTTALTILATTLLFTPPLGGLHTLCP